MSISHDIFGPGSNPKRRIVHDYDVMRELVNGVRTLGMRIVLTSGTFDMWHEGHARYLEKAREKGDILIVGVDSDVKVRSRKGPHRPADSEDRRMEMVCHSRHADLVFLKGLDDPHWQLIKVVRPNVLVATADTYNGDELNELKEYCEEIEVLPPQAATSTTARMRNIIVGTVGQIREKLNDFDQFLSELEGGGKK